MTKTITHKPKGNKFSYMKAILLAMSLLFLVTCNDDDNNTPAKDTTAPTVSSVNTVSTTSVTSVMSIQITMSEPVMGNNITPAAFVITGHTF